MRDFCTRSRGSRFGLLSSSGTCFACGPANPEGTKTGSRNGQKQVTILCGLFLALRRKAILASCRRSISISLRVPYSDSSVFLNLAHFRLDESFFPKRYSALLAPRILIFYFTTFQPLPNLTSHHHHAPFFSLSDPYLLQSRPGSQQRGFRMEILEHYHSPTDYSSHWSLFNK